MSDNVPNQEDPFAQLFGPEFLLDPEEGFPNFAGDSNSLDHWIEPDVLIRPDPSPSNPNGLELAIFDAQPSVHNELLDYGNPHQLFGQSGLESTLSPMHLNNSDTFLDPHRLSSLSNTSLSLGPQWDPVAGTINGQVDGDFSDDFVAHQYYPLVDDSLFQIEDASNDQANEFPFVSGCRPLAPSPVKSPDCAESSSKVNKHSKLRCTFEGCKSKRTFKRIYELRRHEKEHNGGQRYPCPAIGCNRIDDAGFLRPDKLGDHIAANHDLDARFKCSIDNCSMGPYTSAIFRLHLLNHYSIRFIHATTPEVLAKNLDKFIQKCPVKDCKCRIHTPGKPHILTHSEEDRSELSDGFREKGYDASTGYVLCPICQDQAKDVESFAEHLELKHLTLDADHFTAWKAMYEKACRKWVETPPRIWLKWKVSGIEKLKCPICPFQQDIPGFSGLTDHHASLRQLGSEVEEHAEEILRILPGFGMMPIFDKFMPRTNQRNAYTRT
ncbi:MAG: hypothetical protein M1821_004524 [Bathelium mastoideum]|nr:MAG: hypothetical protein M1821_004524 [Bathelium mastoideum]